MAALVPTTAAKLAQSVYGLVDSNYSLEKNVGLIKQDLKTFLLINDKSLLTATSGMGFIQARTVFGIASFGVNAYAGHAFIVLRGTDLLGDALTRSEERRVGKECRSRWSAYH